MSVIRQHLRNPLQLVRARHRCTPARLVESSIPGSGVGPTSSWAHRCRPYHHLEGSDIVLQDVLFYFLCCLHRPYLKIYLFTLIDEGRPIIIYFIHLFPSIV